MICFHPPSSNFEMAVSYGATFPVLVLLMSIAFTGYLEVNKHLNVYWNSWCDYDDAEHFCVKHLNVSLFPEVAFQDATGCSVDLWTVPRCLHQGSAAAVCGHSLCAHHSADGLPQLGEFLLCLTVISPCSSFLFLFALIIFFLCCCCCLVFVFQIFLPGNNCTSITNKTELENLKLYTVPVSTLPCLIFIIKKVH